MGKESSITLDSVYGMSVGDTFYLNDDLMIVSEVLCGTVSISIFIPPGNSSEILLTKPKQPNFTRFQNKFKRRGR